MREASIGSPPKGASRPTHSHPLAFRPQCYPSARTTLASPQLLLCSSRAALATAMGPTRRSLAPKLPRRLNIATQLRHRLPQKFSLPPPVTPCALESCTGPTNAIPHHPTRVRDHKLVQASNICMAGPLRVRDPHPSGHASCLKLSRHQLVASPAGPPPRLKNHRTNQNPKTPHPAEWSRPLSKPSAPVGSDQLSSGAPSLGIQLVAAGGLPRNPAPT